MKRILYIQVGPGFVYINRNVIAQLKNNFPDHEVELFDVLPEATRNPWVIFINSLYTLWEYFPDFIAGRKSIFKLKYLFLGTTYIFNHFSRLIARKLKEKNYEFVFQSQCLCDSSGHGIPVYIYTDHTNLNNLNYRFIDSEKFMRTRKFIELERRALMNANYVFVMSKNIGDSLEHQYGLPASKIKLVYAGSNTSVPPTIDHSKYHNKNIIFVGKEWERKGGPLLIEAFKKVVERVPDATLTVIGCNPDVNVPNCKILGELPLPEVAKHYARASVFCMPTVREPFGIVFVEAMFNRLPIVTNNMGAAPYFVTDKNGYLLENNAEDFANALVDLITHPEKCDAFGEESLRIGQESYTWENTGIHMAESIRGVAVEHA